MSTGNTNTTAKPPLKKRIISPFTPTHGPARVAYHPIAIKPKPIQRQASSEITLTTSRTWVLPPRPKTKKMARKPKQKKQVPLPNAATEAASAKATTATATPTAATITPSTLAVSIETPAVLPGIRSVLTRENKTFINAQVHSNIDLNTNDEVSLKTQLDVVRNENENLKKILQKLNRDLNMGQEFVEIENKERLSRAKERPKPGAKQQKQQQQQQRQRQRQARIINSPTAISMAELDEDHDNDNDNDNDGLSFNSTMATGSPGKSSIPPMSLEGKKSIAIGVGLKLPQAFLSPKDIMLKPNIKRSFMPDVNFDMLLEESDEGALDLFEL